VVGGYKWLLVVRQSVPGCPACHEGCIAGPAAQHVCRWLLRLSTCCLTGFTRVTHEHPAALAGWALGQRLASRLTCARAMSTSALQTAAGSQVRGSSIQGVMMCPS
jgi:hypothetical protein